MFLLYTVIMNRILKQVVIAGVYLGLLALLVWPFYRAANPVATCSDGRHNGTEEGVDCGATCGLSCPEVRQDVAIVGASIVANADTSSDGIVTLRNPNSTHSATRLVVVVRAFDKDGSDVAKSTQITYANPVAEQFLVVPFVRALNVASVSATIVPSESVWEPVTATTPERVSLVVRDERIVRDEAASRYVALVANQSLFSVGAVDITVRLLDRSGQVRVVGSTQVTTLAPGQEREFVIAWPFVVPEDLEARVAVSTNLLQDGNLQTPTGANERFQQY